MTAVRYFDGHRFDETDLLLWRGAERVRLTAKAAAVLGCLLEGDGAPVSREELLRRVWPDVNVHPDNIKVLVHEIRTALGDDSRDPRFVRTEARRGYAFIAGSSARPDPPAETGEPTDDRDRHFVNRGAALARLSEALMAVAAGQPTGVYIEGPIGIGRSALCRAFLRMAPSLHPFRKSEVGCGAIEPGPLAVCGHLLRSLARQHPGLASLIQAHAPAWTPFVGAGSASPGSLDVSACLAGLDTLLAVLTADLPLILVLDDVDCADAESRMAVSRLARAAGSVLTVATGPPGGSPWRHDGAAERQVTLEPLPPEQVARYLDARFGDAVVSHLAVGLCAASEGVPARMVGLIDDAVASGVLVQIGGSWTYVATMAAVDTLWRRDAQTAPLPAG